ncbi:MAG: SNF2-related protein [Alphaproteobacteria bacterium]|nr:SNF2-related protein [Alphaproteobacteria bacterium]
MKPKDRRKSRPPIVSNRGLTMEAVINTNLPRLDTLDVSTGYFDIAGFAAVAGELMKRARAGMPVRLLVGSDLISGAPRAFEEYAEANADDGLTFAESMRRAELGEEAFKNAVTLVEFIDLPNVEVRRTTGSFNHSKCYIMNDVGVLIGSSNFTGNGLEHNLELNAGIYDTNGIEEAEKWFETVWGGARDAKEDLRSQVLESKLGAPADPYTVYMKMIFEKYRDMLRSARELDIADQNLTGYQQDAVRVATHITGKFGGVIIADATGLGKTKISMEIIRQKIGQGRRPVLIAPAQIIKTVWNREIEESGLPIHRVVSAESIGQKHFDKSIKKYRKTDLVIIDESHNFRSKTATRRSNLMRLLATGRRKEVILLTATPINNSIMDLYYQVSLMTGGDDKKFWDTIGIPDLYRHMKRAANHETLNDGLGKIQQLLDHVMVRRTRSYIKKAFPNDRINGRPIVFPKHEYERIDYSLAEIYGNVFKRMVDGIERLTMAPYGIDYYDQNRSKDEQNHAKRIAYLQTPLLLKRFESSHESMRISVENKLRLYKKVREHLEKGNILSIKRFRDLMAKHRPSEMGEDVEAAEKRFEDELSGITPTPIPARFDSASFMEDIDADIEILEQMLAEVKKIRIDAKLRAVMKTIENDRALDTQSRKVLLFTEYAATAKYLKREIESHFKEHGKRVMLITGSTTPERRSEIIAAFAPDANTGEDDRPVETADILISTEVLSEGQNLQDCNYVLNYDLPWNPMRIVQRTGRVDRLTSRFSAIRTRACFPDRELDEIMKLQAKIYQKIGVANETVGLQDDLLGEAPSERQFNGGISEDMLALAGRKGSAENTVERLQREADMFEFSPLMEIQSYLRDRGFENMENVPMGRRAGKAGTPKCAVLAYRKKAGRHAVYFVKYDHRTKKATAPEEDDSELMRLVRCAPGTEPYMPSDTPGGFESFRELVAIDREARAAVMDKISNDRELARQILSGRTTRIQGLVSRMEKCALDAFAEGDITSERSDRIMALLGDQHVHTWAPHLKDIMDEYEEDGDRMAAIEKIEERVESMYITDRLDDEDAVADTDPELELVGAMFITPEAGSARG